jgi:hypothetical protein
MAARALEQGCATGAANMAKVDDEIGTSVAVEVGGTDRPGQDRERLPAALPRLREHPFHGRRIRRRGGPEPTRGLGVGQESPARGDGGEEGETGSAHGGTLL